MIKSETISTYNEMRFAEVPQSMLIKMLTDTYADPLAAAIRETVSNAIDACSRRGVPVADGLRVSFKKNIYTDGYRYITVSDAGDGMDRNRLTDNFLTYASSTKGGDGSAIGAFGLGAKAPLAYTDAMSVYTRTDGGDTLHAVARRTPDGGAEFTTPVVVDDPARMIDGTGTIVSFEVREDDYYRAKNILAGIAGVLISLEGSGCCKCIDIVNSLPATDDLYIPRYIPLGKHMVAGTDGKPVEANVFARDMNTRTKVQDFLTAAAAGYPFEACCCHLGYNDIAYRVGQWLYPADGSMWDFNYPELVIEVPNKTLPFTPSRDTLINDGGQSRLIADNVLEALVAVYGEGTASERGSRLLRTIYSFNIAGNYYKDAMRWAPRITDANYSDDSITYKFGDDDGHTITFSLDELRAWGSGSNGEPPVTIGELMNTGNCIGIVASRKSGAVRGYVSTSLNGFSKETEDATPATLLKWFEGGFCPGALQVVRSSIVGTRSNIRDIVDCYHSGNPTNTNVVMPLAAKLLGLVNVDALAPIAKSSSMHKVLTCGKYEAISRLITFNAANLSGREVVQVATYLAKQSADERYPTGIVALLDEETDEAAELRKRIIGKLEFVRYTPVSDDKVKRILSMKKTSRTSAESRVAANISRKVDELSKLLYKSTAISLKPKWNTGTSCNSRFITSNAFSKKNNRVACARKWVERGNTLGTHFIILRDIDSRLAYEMIPLAEELGDYSMADWIVILDAKQATNDRVALLNELESEILYDCDASEMGRGDGVWSFMSIASGTHAITVDAPKPRAYAVSELAGILREHKTKVVSILYQNARIRLLPYNNPREEENEYIYFIAAECLNNLSFGSFDTSVYEEAVAICKENNSTKALQFNKFINIQFIGDNSNTIVDDFSSRLQKVTNDFKNLVTMHHRLLNRYGVVVKDNLDDFKKSIKAFELFGGRELVRAYVEDGMSIDDIIPEF